MTSLPLRLRTATAEAHERLERSLDLLRSPPSRDRFIALLQRFWGFHAVWEPAIAADPALSALMTGRDRLGLIADDLAALGLSPASIAALPRCEAAAGLTAPTMRALGSIYVMEGSTLGGRVIAKTLEGAAWVPSSGLRYFNPHGADTGVMWRGVQDALSQASTAESDPLIERGAADTFTRLNAWLTP